MKTVFYITVLTLLFAIIAFSQERNRFGVLPDKPTSERPREIHKPNVDDLPRFEVIESLLMKSKSSNWQTSLRNQQRDFYEVEGFDAKDTRTTINKTLLGDGFLLIEQIQQTWDGSALVNTDKSSFTYNQNNNLTEEVYQSWDYFDWKNVWMRSYSYNINNNLIEEFQKSWEYSAWVIKDKYAYTYDGDNNLIEKVGGPYDGVTWDPVIRWLYTYD